MDVDTNIKLSNIHSLYEIQSRYRLPPLKGLLQRPPLKIRVRQAFRKVEVVAGLVAAVKNNRQQKLGSFQSQRYARPTYNRVSIAAPQPSRTDNHARRQSLLTKPVNDHRSNRLSILLPPVSQRKNTLHDQGTDNSSKLLVPGSRGNRASILRPPVSKRNKSLINPDQDSKKSVPISGHANKGLQPIEEM